MSSKGKPIRAFDIDGWEVLVGRGDEENDFLTFHVAQKCDLWLHVGGGIAGSHVVVRNPEGGEIPKDVVERAAGLAAWHSKARGAPRVEVHLCRVADVSKPRGAPLGQVEIRRHKKIKVKPGNLDPGNLDKKMMWAVQNTLADYHVCNNDAMLQAMLWDTYVTTGTVVSCDGTDEVCSGPKWLYSL